MIRNGPEDGPNRVFSVQDDRLTLTSSDVGFRMLSRATIADDKILVAHIRTAPQGARWCEIELTPGAVAAYGPSSEHTAINPPGVWFTFVITDRDELAGAADTLQVDIQPPPPGQVHELVPSSRSGAAAAAMGQLTEAVESGVGDYDASADDVIHAMVDALSVEDRVTRIGCGRGPPVRRLVPIS